MPRILPDIHDQIVWQLSETSGNFRNTGQFLPQNALTDLVPNNSNISQLGTGVLFPNCPQIPGTSNFPAGSSASRNYFSGASTVTITPPMTVSCWVNLRSYTTNNNQGIIGKEYRNPTLSGNTWTTPFYAFIINVDTGNGGGDWGPGIATSASSSVGMTVTDFPIPLGTWSHVGVTLDGTFMRTYLNGCQMISSGNPTVNTVAYSALSYSDGTNGLGAWKIGSIIATGSSSKEEPNAQIQDVRIANVVRSLSYFQKIYASAALPLQTGSYVSNQFYKLRSYDLSCTPNPLPVVWVDTQVSLANVPPSPCGSPTPNFSAPEVLDTWFQ